MRITFTEDDAFIGDLIKAARIKVEKRHNRSLVRRKVTVLISNGNGKVELPYGPVVNGISYVLDNEGENQEFTVRGTEYPYIESPISDHLEVSYTAGYLPSTIPEDLKREIAEEVAYLYRHAGDEKRENSSKIWIL
jgi:hypothetical protein